LLFVVVSVVVADFVVVVEFFNSILYRSACVESETMLFLVGAQFITPALFFITTTIPNEINP